MIDKDISFLQKQLAKCKTQYAIEKDKQKTLKEELKNHNFIDFSDLHTTIQKMENDISKKDEQLKKEIKLLYCEIEFIRDSRMAEDVRWV